MKRWLALTGLILMLGHGSAWSQDEDAESAQEGSEAAVEDEVVVDEQEQRRVRRLGDVIGEESQEWSMGIPTLDMPQTPVAEQPDVTLPDPVLDEQLQNLLTRRAFVPDDPDIEAALSDLLDEVELQAREALAADDLPLASRLVGVISVLDDNREVVAEVNAEQQRADNVVRLLSQAEEALGEGNLVEPADASAWALYGQVLEIEDDNADALAGQDSVRSALLDQAEALIDQDDFEAAEDLLDEAAEREADAERIAALDEMIALGRQDQVRSMIASVRAAIDDERYDDAEAQINQLIALGASSEQTRALQSSLDDAMQYGGFEPGQVFQDGLGSGDQVGPVMVVVPAGSFMMGSPEDEDDRVSNEGPRFRVTFDRGFAMARTEVTVGQFAQFVAETGYVTDAQRKGSSRVYQGRSGRVDERDDVDWRLDYQGDPADDTLPVVHVSWNDAAAYAEWLARRTGRSYRLPSEAEFEYALRAGTQTPYWWGDGSPDDPVENVTGDGDRFTDNRSWTVAFNRYEDGFWGPAPVGSLQTNPFSLYDMGGNVMEWILDCWHDSYVRAPDDGSAWVNPGCERRVIRGASWSSTPSMSRSAFRLSSQDSSTDARVGFRVARDL